MHSNSNSQICGGAVFGTARNPVIDEAVTASPLVITDPDAPVIYVMRVRGTGIVAVVAAPDAPAATVQQMASVGAAVFRRRTPERVIGGQHRQAQCL
jgi:hypothetical protein